VSFSFGKDSRALTSDLNASLVAMMSDNSDTSDNY
jgi:hypothetical protein